MNAVPNDPYIRNNAGHVIGHYSSESLPGGKGNLKIGFKFQVEWNGRMFGAEVVGFEARCTNPYDRVIIRYMH